MMELKAPEGCGGVSWGGRSYPVVDGLVEVPDQATVLLEPGYGFVLAPVKDSTPKSATKTKNSKAPPASLAALGK